MKVLKCLPLVALLAIGVAHPTSAVAKDKKEFVMVNEAVGVPVFPHDITDRPYEVIGEVKAGVRKATIFSKEASQEKIYKELWERGEKLGADAIINAQYGDSHVTALSWGKTNATGTAIRFAGDMIVTPAANVAAVAPIGTEAPAVPETSEAPTELVAPAAPAAPETGPSTIN